MKLYYLLSSLSLVAASYKPKDAKCYVDIFTSLKDQTDPIQRIDFDVEGSLTRCRSVVDAEIKIFRKSNKTETLDIECYAQYGCAGDVVGSIDSLLSKSSIKTCRLVNPCGHKNDTIYAPPKNKTMCVHGRNTYGEDKPMPLTRSIHAAVLFEEIKYGGIKHWIDGKVGECRGLSGVPVKSIRAVDSPGGDPFTSAIDDEVTLAFFDDYGCVGKVIGAVTGGSPDVTKLLASGPKSVRFVATGLDNKFYAAQFNGVDDQRSAASSKKPLFIAGLVAIIALIF